MIKNIVLFVTGVIFALFSVLIVKPYISDYMAYSEVYNWIVQLDDLKKEIEIKLTEGEEVNVLFPTLVPEAMFYTVTDTGVIIVSGGKEGQVLVLIPRRGDSIIWTCVVGPNRASPKQCRTPLGAN
jgi:hypothetical protein